VNQNWLGAMVQEEGKVKNEKFDVVDFAFERCKLKIIYIRKCCINLFSGNKPEDMKDLIDRQTS